MGTDTNFSKSGSSPGNVGNGFAPSGGSPGVGSFMSHSGSSPTSLVVPPSHSVIVLMPRSLTNPRVAPDGASLCASASPMWVVNLAPRSQQS